MEKDIYKPRTMRLMTMCSTENNQLKEGNKDLNEENAYTCKEDARQITLSDSDNIISFDESVSDVLNDIDSIVVEAAKHDVIFLDKLFTIENIPGHDRSNSVPTDILDKSATQQIRTYENIEHDNNIVHNKSHISNKDIQQEREFGHSIVDNICTLNGETAEEDGSGSPVKSRKRKTNPDSWKKNKRKCLLNSGEEYISTKGKCVPEKEFRFYLCKCNFGCNSTFSEERRREIHSNFYKLKDWNLKTMFINSTIKVTPVKRKRKASDKRSFSRHYYFTNKDGEEREVCKNVYKHTLRISDGRIAHTLSKSSPHDLRGKHSPHNKTNSTTVQHVKEFIKQFPAYQSHYCRKKAPHRLYLSPSLNLKKMYDLYLDNCKEQNPVLTPCSLFIFRQVFNNEFNYYFHPLQKDTCKKCNILKNLIDSSSNEADKTANEMKRREHHLLAEMARNEMKKDAAESKRMNSGTCVIAFDLMKTLPTPDLDVGICYYKRQLWSYIFGVHNMTTDKVYLYLWHEGQASRGPNEIASCLLHFFTQYTTEENVIMYSDQCGGQNKNIKIVTALDYFVNSDKFRVKKIDHKFLMSGHSYLPCDQGFGLVEKERRYHNQIYTPSDWAKVAQSACKNKFTVHQMCNKDFKSFAVLLRRVTNRKKNDEGDKVSWRDILQYQLNNGSDLKMNYKYSYEDGAVFREVNLRKRRAIVAVLEPLPDLYPNGRRVDNKKLKDISDLMQFIPPVSQEFYKKLKGSDDTDEIMYTSSNEDD